MNTFEDNMKYQAIYKSAREIFWKHGVKRVSVEEICKKAGVSKMTFYKYFPNKIELAKHVYNRILDEAMKQFRVLLESDMPAADKLKKIIELKVASTHNISQEFILDLYQNLDLDLKNYAEGISKRSWDMILEYFGEAQQKGVFRKDMRPEFLLYYSQKITEMVSDEKLIQLCGSPEETIKELVNFFIYGVSNHE